MIELTVVVAIIAILAAMLFPVFARAREKSRSQTCAANLLNMGLALRIYATDYAGQLPPGLAGPAVLADLGLIYAATTLCPSCAACPSFPGQEAPSEPQLPPGVPAQPQGPPGPGAPPVPPGAPPPGAPGATVPPVTPGPPETAYVYQPGLSLRFPRHAVLVADARARHDGRANVLFDDGALHSLPMIEWDRVLPPDLARESGWTTVRENKLLGGKIPPKGGVPNE